VLHSHDQARSFASNIPDMHNEHDDFQYFVLDFNEDAMAFHAGDILSKAAFANEALKFIQQLYANRSQGTLLFVTCRFLYV
jgi:hemerythrin-like domain-containing protein